MKRLTLLVSLSLFATIPTGTVAAQSSSSSTLTAREKAEKQQQNEEAETLCRSIQDKDKFDECMDLYFLDAKKFKEFLDKHSRRPAPATN
ncbi:hypothetical protein [Niveispirillum irakense]|uniref:hypothetical protein n=1 Tax=Niveispirillum irakense TaxID=34011 RepID=UPI0003FF4EBA|nr:hypothetical protein [Niveispirillum irakense]